MNFKKTLAVVICLILMISCVTVAASAATASQAKITVSADKTEAKIGDIVTFNVYIDASKAPEGIYSYDCSISLSGGLELVADSDEADQLVSFYQPSFSGLRLVCSGYNAEITNGKGYTGNEKIATFQCKVNGEGTATVENVKFTENGYSEVLDKVVNVTTYGSGNSVTITIPCDHDYGAWKVIEAATCTKDGIEQRICSICNEKETRPIDKLGHDISDVKGYAATCTEDGLTDGQKCSRCDYEVKGTVIPALGHDLQTVAGKAATCTEDGLTDGQKCSRCDYEVKGTVIPAPGHDWSSDDKAATCTEAGVEGGKHCTVCGEVIEGTVIPALGHKWDEGAVTKEPTCSEEGEKTYTCTACGETKVEKIAKLAHEEKYISNEDGTHDVVCKNCNTILKDNEKCFDVNPKDGKCDGCGYEIPETPTTKPTEDDDEDDDVPKTGDITPYPVYFLIAMMAVAATAYGLKRKFDI